MGPEPYCFHHRTYPPNAKDHDSIMRYLSHLTFREIREVKDGIKNDLFFIRFLDTLLMYKDSLQYALTGSRDFTLDD